MRTSEAAVREHDPLRDILEVTQGGIFLSLPTPDAGTAATHFERGAALARQRGARMVEVEALTGLAGIRVGDERREVLQRLDQLYDWFTEGFDTPQLRSARAVLDRTG